MDAFDQNMKYVPHLYLHIYVILLHHLIMCSRNSIGNTLSPSDRATLDPAGCFQACQLRQLLPPPPPPPPPHPPPPPPVSPVPSSRPSLDPTSRQMIRLFLPNDHRVDRHLPLHLSLPDLDQPTPIHDADPARPLGLHLPLAHFIQNFF